VAARQIRVALGGPALLLLSAAVYLCAALALLRQWNSPQPWARLDVFSGGYLVLILFWAYDQHRWHQVVFRSKELLNEAAGMSYDPALVRWSRRLKTQFTQRSGREGGSSRWSRMYTSNRRRARRRFQSR
jgi:hypothetical protein